MLSARILGLVLLTLPALPAAGSVVTQFSSFEAGLNGWDRAAAAGLRRVASGSGGVASASGEWHAEVRACGTQESPCLTYGGWSEHPGAFPENGFATGLSIFLDPRREEAGERVVAIAAAAAEGWRAAPPDAPGSGGFQQTVLKLTLQAGSPGRILMSATDDCSGSVHEPEPVAVDGAERGWYTLRFQFSRDDRGLLRTGAEITAPDGRSLGQLEVPRAAPTRTSRMGGGSYLWVCRNSLGALPIDDSVRLEPGPVETWTPRRRRVAAMETLRLARVEAPAGVRTRLGGVAEQVSRSLDDRFWDSQDSLGPDWSEFSPDWSDCSEPESSRPRLPKPRSRRPAISCLPIGRCSGSGAVTPGPRSSRAGVRKASRKAAANSRRPWGTPRSRNERRRSRSRPELSLPASAASGMPGGNTRRPTR